MLSEQPGLTGHNPTASVSTSPGSVLRLSDYEGKADRFGRRIEAQRNRQVANRGVARASKTSAYVGIIESPLYSRDHDNDKFIPSVNAEKPRGNFATLVEAVKLGRVSIETIRAQNPNQARKIERILSR